MQLFKKSTDGDLAEKLAWMRLSRTENVGPVTFYKLVDAYGSASEALRILPELTKRGGRQKPLNAPDEGQIEKEYQRLKKIGGDIITADSAAYPVALSTLSDAPPVLSVLGNVSLLNQSCIGIVGARNASVNGRKMAEKLAGELGARGQIIVSGLARGIDTAAHKGSLKTGTIAVVAGGIDVVYPEENQNLYEQIIEHGLIVAESPFAQKPFAQSFPRRNRIVSGISKGVVVVEATMRSGSLITARLAGEQGRDVYAVPGHPFDPRAGGPNYLIRQGATLVTKADDVMEGLMNFSGGMREIAVEQENYESFDVLEPREMPENVADMICEHLSYTPVNIDELIRSTGLDVPVIQTTLLELELAGRIKHSAGNRVSLVN